MGVPSADLLDDTLFRAAELRAGGLGWDATAAKLDMDSRTLRGLTMTESGRWRKLMRDADRAVLSDAGHEAHRVVAMPDAVFRPLWPYGPVQQRDGIRRACVPRNLLCRPVRYSA